MMYRKDACWLLQPILPGLLFFLTQCHLEVSTEQEQADSKAADAIEVTSFNIERENSPDLANWAVFEAGKEIICAPPSWKSYVDSQGDLVVIPPDSKDSIERVEFSRFAKDSKSLDYDTVALKMVKAAFHKFSVQKTDTLKKLNFQHDFGYEQNTTFLANGLTHKGYCIVYIDDSSVYKFRIILSDNRLRNYNGKLMSDITGNLQINKHYIMDNNNPVKSIKFIK
jgi:hypothetical protein